MIRFAPVAGLVLLAACGLSEAKFQDELTKLSCEWSVDCFENYDSVDDCIADATESEVDADCTYDAAAAKECLDGVANLTCDDTAVPAVCADVYTCPEDTDTGAR